MVHAGGNKTDRIISRMIPLSADTPLEVEQRWLQGLREKGAVWRLAQAISLSSHCWRAAQVAFQRARPQADIIDKDTWLLQERYGPTITSQVVERRRQQGFYDR